jgi:DNA-binding HxlR family transcriptional regulator
MSRDKTAHAGAYRPARPDPLAECPLNAAFSAVGGKWKLTILYWLSRETHHFSALLRRLSPIAHKVLSEQLRELEAEGLVARVSDGPVPAPVHYHLTGYGRSVLPLVEHARLWGMAHLQRRRGVPIAAATEALACAEPLALLSPGASADPARDDRHADSSARPARRRSTNEAATPPSIPLSRRVPRGNP